MSWNARKIAGATVAATGGAALGDWMNRQGTWGRVGASALGVAPLAYGEHVVAGDEKWNNKKAWGAFSPYVAWRERDKGGDKGTLADRIAKDSAARDSEYNDQAQYVDSLQKQQDQARTGALSSLESGYGMADRQAQHEAYYADSLNKMLQDAGQQYGVALNRAGGDAAARGVLGGSNYAENQASLGNTLRSQAVDATQQAYGTLNEQNQSDLNEYGNLRNAVQSGDPQSAAAYNALAQGQNNDAERAMRQVGFQDAYANLRMQGANNTSQMYGAWGNSAANGVRSYYGGSY